MNPIAPSYTGKLGISTVMVAESYDSTPTTTVPLDSITDGAISICDPNNGYALATTSSAQIVFVRKVSQPDTFNIISPVITVANIQRYRYEVYAAAVNQVVNITMPTPVIGNTYSLKIMDQNASNLYGYNVPIFSHTATTTSTADLINAFVSIINNSRVNLEVTASNQGPNTTLRITAKNPYVNVLVDLIDKATWTGSTVVTYSTPGFSGAGTPARVLADERAYKSNTSLNYIQNAPGFLPQPVFYTVSNSNYNTFYIDFFEDYPLMDPQTRGYKHNNLTIYLKTDGTGAAAFKTLLESLAIPAKALV